MPIIDTPATREQWLALRTTGIGGSDAAAVIGASRYKSNLDLWNEKTGRTIPADISNKPAVLFGKTAEAPLRELFKLDLPQYKVDYHEFYMYRNSQHPFIFATLDGELTDPEGRRGILEIKTCTIQNKLQWDDWDNALPRAYYVQLLHQLAATGWDYARLMAYIRFYKDGELRVSVRHYYIERSEVQAQIDSLIEREIIFWKDVQNGTAPAQLLPEI